MFEMPVFGRRKTKETKVENLYKILGTRSNIGQNRIKEKYIEKLRQFPPETHPEEFQEIRKAYEILKDEKKRKQYDMTRKHGTSVDKIIEEIGMLMSLGDWKKAKELLNYMLEIDPNDIGAKLILSELYLELEDFEQFYSIIDDIIECMDDVEKEFIILVKFDMLSSRDYLDKALEALEDGKRHITDIETYYWLRIMTFMDSNNYIKAWEEFKDALPSLEEQNIDHLNIFIAWLVTAMELEKWEQVSKIQKRFQRLFQSLSEEDDIYILKTQLFEEIESYVDVVRYREADAFMQILIKVDPKNTYLSEWRKEIKDAVKLETELSRAYKDPELIPYVYVEMLDLYLMKYSSDEYYKDFHGGYPHGMMEEMQEMKLEIGSGVLRVKKRYPNLYKEFKRELEVLFNESTENLNREQRRMLR